MNSHSRNNTGKNLSFFLIFNFGYFFTIGDSHFVYLFLFFEERRGGGGKSGGKKRGKRGKERERRKVRKREDVMLLK